MRFKTLQIKGLVPFPELQTLTFPAGRTVAVTGDNGAGKTTLLDCIPMALFGAAPNRSGFYSMFRGADALIDFEWEMHGHTYWIKRLINANSRTQKLWFFKDGQTLTEGKTAEFDAAVAQHLGISEQGFLASVYHAQSGKGNPLTLDDKGRRDLLSEVLGLSRFDNPHALAIAEVQTIDRDIDRLEIQVQGLRAINLDIEAVKGLLARANSSRDTLAGEIGAIETALQEARQQVANAKANANAQGVDELKRQIQTCNDQINADQRMIADKQSLINRNERELLGQRAAIEAAVVTTDTLTADIDALNTQRDAALAKLKDVQGEHKAQLADKQQAVAVAQAQLKLADSDLLSGENAIKDLLRKEQNLNASIILLKAQTGLLSDVPCVGTDLQPGCKLLAQANTAQATIPQLDADLISSKSQLMVLTAQRDQTWVIVDVFKSTLKLAQTEWQSVQDHNPGADLLTLAEQMGQAVRNKQAELSALAALVRLHANLAGVDERISNYRQEIDVTDRRVLSVSEALSKAEAKLAEASDLSATVSKCEAETRRLEDERRTAQAGYDSALAQIGQAQANLEQSQALETKALDLQAGIAVNRDRLATATLLREALGPKGARALKIDSAGPEIGELVNTLLRECYGQRFTIGIKTLRELTSKEGEYRECLDFAIIDNTTGQETVVENKSGGEQALIKEVISLGLCIYQRRRSGIDTRTLVRDECSAPLSEANTVLYINMLGKACEIGGFEQVLYVSHKSNAQSMADAEISIKDGVITVKKD